MFVASLRTTAAIALVFLLLAVTFLLLGIGNAGAHDEHRQGRRLRRHRDGGGGVVCLVRRGDEFDVRPDGAAGAAAGPASRPRKKGKTRWRPDQQSLEQRLERAAGRRVVRPARGVRRRGADHSRARAARRPGRVLGQQAEALDWFEPGTQSLDDSDPPFYKWFAGGKLNASHNCLDRHVEAGNGDRVAFHWHGEEGEDARRHLRRPAPRRPAVRQRAEGPRRRARATSSGSTCR